MAHGYRRSESIFAVEATPSQELRAGQVMHGLAEGIGVHWRALVESDISRWKRVIGNGLRARTDGRQEAEAVIAANALNRMLDLGRPEYIRIA
jgi:hypothetical protein